MKSSARLLVKNPWLTVLYLLFITVYILQAILPVPDKTTLTKYSLSILSAKLLGLSVEVPYILIWIVSLVGFLRLKTYVRLIRRDKDGAAFQTIAHGILYLTLWLPLSAVVGNFFTQIYRYHPATTANLVRLNIYFSLIVLFMGFWFVYKGSAKLLPLISRNSFQASLLVILIYVTFAALYTFLTLHDPARALPTRSVSLASYYEPDWLIITTTVIPRLIYWFLGIQAVYNIYLYNKQVKGRLYRSSLKNLALGLSGVLATTIVLRCLQSLSSVLEEWSLGLLLALIYALLIIIGFGYFFIARGAHGLQRLEEA